MNPVDSSAAFTFSPAITLPAGQSVALALSGVIAGGATGSLDLGKQIRCAGIMTSGGMPDRGERDGLMLALGLLGFAILPMRRPERLRASIPAMVALSLLGWTGSSGGARRRIPRHNRCPRRT